MFSKLSAPLWLSALFLFAIPGPLQAQQLSFSPPDPLVHGPDCNIRSSPGILGQHYYILVNDYGTRVGLHNRIDSYLKIYNTQTGRLEKTINLNDQVADGAGRRIVFTDLMVWKGRLLGLYTMKRPASPSMEIHAQRFDAGGRKQGKPQVLGLFANPLKGRYVSVGVEDGMNLPGVADMLHCSFNSDSSAMVFFSLPERGKGDIGFTVVDPELRVLERIHMPMPAVADRNALMQFELDNNGRLYLLAAGREGGRLLPSGNAKSYFSLFILEAGHSRPKEISLYLPGHAVADAFLTRGRDGRLFVLGTCYADEKPGRHDGSAGTFAIAIDSSSGEVRSTDLQMFSRETLKALHDRKTAYKSGKDKEIYLGVQAVPLPDGGIALWGQSRSTAIYTMGQTGAMRIVFNLFGNVALTRVGADGRIAFQALVPRNRSNPALNTSTGPVYADYLGGRLTLLHDDDGQRHRRGVFAERYDGRGRLQRSFTPLPKSFSRVDIVWSTAKTLNAHQVIAAYHAPRKKDMGTAIITVTP